MEELTCSECGQTIVGLHTFMDGKPQHAGCYEKLRGLQLTPDFRTAVLNAARNGIADWIVEVVSPEAQGRILSAVHADERARYERVTADAPR